MISNSENKKFAFLRGVNVNGRKVLMKDVCEVFTRTGMENVSSVLASGNMIFGSPLKNEDLRKLLEAALSLHYSDRVDLFVKDAEELRTIVENDPFDNSKEFHTYVFISEKGMEKELEKLFNDIVPASDEEGIVSNGTFYWKVPKGNTLTSGFSRILGRKDLRDKFTSRNINTLKQMIEHRINSSRSVRPLP
jgi:Uncharacterized protein conserved in bacteria